MSYLLTVDEPLGPFQTYGDRNKAYIAVGILPVGYKMNTRQWQCGDLVIHWCDDKKPYMLMKVIGFTRDGLVKTQYLDPSRHGKKVWTNEFTSLLDPADFGIEVPVE